MKDPSQTPALLRDLYTTMRRIRFFEENVIAHYPEQEMRTPVHLCIGQEAIAAAVCTQLRKSDYIFSTHRNHGHCLAKGMTYYQLLAEFYGKVTGCAGGKGGSMHPVDVDLGILGTTAIVGGNMPLAVGAAWTSTFTHSDTVAVSFFGDGAAEEGTFHESLSFAAVKEIPVIFICENNLYATASHISSRQPQHPSIADRAAAYGIPSCQIDGNNVLEMYTNMARALERARTGGGPSFIEAMTYRWKGHVGPVDDTTTGHRPADELQRWQTRCPLKQFGDYLQKEGVWTNDDEQALLTHLHNEFEKARGQAMRDPFPQEDDCLQFVFQE